MKKLLLQLMILLCASSLFAQWIPVNNGLPNYPPTTLDNWADTIVVSTYGGGIYLSYDSGENWSEMPGSLPNLFVNRIECRGGQFDPISVSTDGGPFISVTGGYIDCNGTGLTNNNVNWWTESGNDWPLVGDAMAGTNGDGIFVAEYTSPFIYDWATSNAGISGDGLIINYGIVGEEVAWLFTDGGVYYANFGDTEWSLSNDGLIGDALKVNDFTYLGVLLISTDGGLYYSANITDPWQPIIPDEKINLSFYLNTDISPTGFMVYAFGENGYYTQDLVNWIPIDFGGIEGEVTAAIADSINLYIGFTTTKKSTNDNGGIYMKPLEQFVVGIEDNIANISGATLNQNFPNPFCETTKITYSLKKSGHINLKVTDLYGRVVQTLVDQFQNTGSYTIQFNVNQLNEGTYFYTLQIGDNMVETKKMIFIQ